MLLLKVESHGSCGVVDEVKIVATIHETCVEGNCSKTWTIVADKLQGYVKIEKLNETAIKIRMEDCSCCDWDYADDIFILDLNLDDKTLILHLVQAKGGYSHDIFINDTKRLHKPGGAKISDKIRHIELKLTKSRIVARCAYG